MWELGRTLLTAAVVSGAVAVAGPSGAVADPAPAAAAGAAPAGVTDTAPAGVVRPAAVAHVARPGVPAPAGDFGWPLSPVPPVSRPFQPPSKPYGPGHRGADLIGAAGGPVLSAGAGVVVYAGPLADRGVVSVEHTGGLRTSYEPVLAAVRPGQRLARGERLGTLAAGHLGCPAAACLHWGLRRDGDYLDPLVLVRPGRVRLLPCPPDRA